MFVNMIWKKLSNTQNETEANFLSILYTFMITKVCELLFIEYVNLVMEALARVYDQLSQAV